MICRRLVHFDIQVGGAGGSRTLVQTYPPKAFYMLIPALFFGNRQGQDEPTCSLSAFASSIQHGDRIDYPVFFCLIGLEGMATVKPASPDIMDANSLN